jgi:hypothetical protein
VLEYERLKKDRRRLLALTGLTRREFEALHQAFRTAYATAYPGDKTADGRVRKREAGGGRKGTAVNTMGEYKCRQSRELEGHDDRSGHS